MHSSKDPSQFSNEASNSVSDTAEPNTTIVGGKSPRDKIIFDTLLAFPIVISLFVAGFFAYRALVMG